MPSTLEQTSTDAAFQALVRSAVLTRRVLEPHFVRHGISGAQWGVLRALQRAEAEGLDSVRATDLSERLLIRIPSVTGTIARLERAGLVRREVDPDDHRSRRLRLTPAGRGLVARVLEGHASRIESLLHPLSDRERSQLAGLLGRVADHLEELAESAPPCENGDRE